MGEGKRGIFDAEIWIMKVFLDTNVLIDVVMNRKPWVDDALVLLELANQRKLSLVAVDLSFINIAYITRKMLPASELYNLLKDLREFVEVVEMGEIVIDDAIKAQWSDMEDCAQYYTAKREKADCIVTRNVKDFTLSDIPVLLPNEFLNSFLN